jgi:cytochrome o ubiquinol oxidase subunit 1
MQHYDDPSWQPYLVIAALGAVVILAGIVCTIVQLVVSIRTRDQRRDETGDPWNGRTLEWSISSPPPPWNFAVLPQVTSEDAFWRIKRRIHEQPAKRAAEPNYEPIDMPKNSPTGFVTAFFAVVTGFALIWHIWWMVLLGIVGAVVTILVFAWRDEAETEIPVDEVARMDRAHRALVAR